MFFSLNNIKQNNCTDISKQQQINVVNRIVRYYSIDSIEFVDFHQNKETGSYYLLFIINNSDTYRTGLVITEIGKLDNSTDEIGLSPVNLFEKFKREVPLTDEELELNNIKITYLKE